MEPAKTIIERLGGAVKVARRLGVAISTVRRWSMPIEKGGTGGRIPQWRWPALIEMAADEGVALDMHDFIPEIGRGR